MNDSFIVTIIETETDNVVVHVEARWEHNEPEADDATLIRAAAKCVGQMIAKIGSTNVTIDIKFCNA